MLLLAPPPLAVFSRLLTPHTSGLAAGQTDEAGVWGRPAEPPQGRLIRQSASPGGVWGGSVSQPGGSSSKRSAQSVHAAVGADAAGGQSVGALVGRAWAGRGRLLPSIPRPSPVQGPTGPSGRPHGAAGTVHGQGAAGLRMRSGGALDALRHTVRRRWSSGRVCQPCGGALLRHSLEPRQQPGAL